MAIIGREATADIVLPFSQVSARHAFIESLGAGRYHVVDLGSSNGTYVSGRRVETAELRRGEDLRLGTVSFNWASAASILDAEASLPPGLILGRDAGCDIVVDDSRVSGRHLRIVPDGSRFRVFDLGSRNGLTVNGQFQSQAVVGSRDRITLGSLSVDLPALLGRRERPTEAVYAPPLASWPLPAPEPVSTVGGAQPGSSRGASRSWVWGLAATAVLALGIAGFLYGTRETLTRQCGVEGCKREIFHETAFFYQVADARRRMEALEPWCETHAAEPVPYKRTVFCRICGDVVSTTTLSAPRRARHGDEQDHSGVCTKQSCILINGGERAMDKGAEVLDKATGGMVGAATELIDRLTKK